jgi:hypothetical protein
MWWDFRFPCTAAFVARFKIEDYTLSSRIKDFKFLLGPMLDLKLWELGVGDGLVCMLVLKECNPQPAGWTCAPLS